MNEKKSCVALGFFDGVHIAHREIILSAVKKAQEENLRPIVLTFDISPIKALGGDVLYLTSMEEKRAIIQSLGGEPEFLKADSTLLNTDCETFVSDILIGKYNAAYVFCGYDYRFGKGGVGNGELLRALLKRYGCRVNITERITIDGEEVSSSRIRLLLSSGNISLANKLLGRPFSVSGIVKSGNRIGAEIGFPTANIYPQGNTPLKHGVYKTLTHTQSGVYKSITNVGVNPTTGGTEMRIETHILNFSGNLYSQKIRVDFIDFLREERHFKSLAELKEQILKDTLKI